MFVTTLIFFQVRMNNWNTKVTRRVKFTSELHPVSACYVPAQSQALRYLHFPQNSARTTSLSPFLQTGNKKIKDSLSHLPKVTQLITMEVGVEAQTVLFQRPNSFCETSTFPIILLWCFCLIFIIHGFSHSDVFLGFCLFQLMEKCPFFMKKMLASSPSDQWSSWGIPTPTPLYPSPHLPSSFPLPTPSWISWLVQLELKKSFLEEERVLLPQFK